MKLEGLGYTYVGGASVGPVSLALRPGERVLLTGPSGSGKSTLLRLAAGLTQRHGQGDVVGQARVDGQPLAGMAPAQRARQVGLVTQDPSDQLVAGSVADELAFGPEGAGFAPEQTHARVGELLAQLGLPAAAAPQQLSAGQRQQLVVAAARSAGARWLLLDEPLGHLDPGAAQRLLEQLDALASAGLGVVVVEHRVDACWAWCDRVVVMRRGQVVVDRPRSEVHPSDLEGLQLPAALGAPAEVVPPPRAGAVVHTLRGLAASYDGRAVLHGVDLVLRAGERVVVVGPNGAGKSTLLRQLPGLRVPEDPDLSLFRATVAEELAVGPTERGLTVDVDRIARALGVRDLWEEPPQALSRGQRLRVAVAAALCCQPAPLVLDEPTTGQDAEHVEGLFDALEALGTSVVFATHDLELAARRAHRVVVLVDGRVVADGPPAEALAAAPLHRAPRVEALLGSGPPQPLPDGVAATVPDPSGPDPRLSLGLLATVGVLAVVLDAPSTLGALALVTALPALAVVGRYRAAMLGVAAAVVWSTMLSQALFYSDMPRVPLVSVGPVTLWREGVVHGLVQSLRLVAMGFAGATVAIATAPDRLLQGLAALRVPWAVAFLAVTSLRMVPLVAREWMAVRQARSRGVPPRQPWARLRDELLLLRPVIARAVRRARTLAEALDARGFDPAGGRVPRVPLRMKGWERMVLGVAGLGALGVVGSEVLYQLYLAEVLYVPQLRPLYAWVR